MRPLLNTLPAPLPRPAAESAWRAQARLAAEFLLIGLVRVYQFTISPLHQAIFGPCCRFHPSCSHYFVLAVRKHGPLQGGWLGVKRICKCHPWHPGGIDLP